MYPDQWHRTYSGKTKASADAILPDLLTAFGVTSLIEIGCGNAHWTQSAKEAGVDDLQVVDGPWNNRDELLVDRRHFVEADLAAPYEAGRRFDMAVCLEVAEHVRHASADILVGTLTDAADVVVFGAAIPFQGGYEHINEQWPSWWREKFAAKGYTAYDLIRPKHWSDQSIHYWYRQNAFVYVANGNAAQVEVAKRLETEAGGTHALFDAVHPDKYADVASYKWIAGKRLARELPTWLAGRLKSRLRLGG